MILGIDSGGTFTDFVLWQEGQLRIHKLLSTPAAPEQAILQGIEELGLMQAVGRGEVTIVHGTTVATNAALEGKGVRTAFITNRGFKDLLTIGRQARSELYNLQPAIQSPPVPAELCHTLNARVDAQGLIVEELCAEELSQLKEALKQLKPQAIAINFLFSYLNPTQEKAVYNALSDLCFCSYSADLLPQTGEYERGIATWLNAYLGPLVKHYLTRLEEACRPATVSIMQSNGGTVAASLAGERSVNLLLSGPAGGLAAAQFFNRQLHERGVMTFDMGGTSTDVALIEDHIQITSEGKLGPYPIAVPMVDMHTIGAGGGSIASIDAGGLLKVGPESAGADPGPACYGKGGKNATVTDANAVLGRLRADNFLGGALSLDQTAAETAVDKLAEQLQIDRLSTALGIIDLADEHMAQALRVISVQRGYDPKDFRLCSFGGAGGLHVCALAEKLLMRRALVPIYSGVLSALGMLVAPRERQLCHTQQGLLENTNNQQLKLALKQLANKGIEQLEAEGVQRDQLQVQASVDLRYQGQNATINVAYTKFDELAPTFIAEHRRLYGHELKRPVELLNLRQRIFAPTKDLLLLTIPSRHGEAKQQVDLPGFGNTAIYWRDDLGQGQTIQGPALICETVATTLIRPNWLGQVDAFGNILLDNYSVASAQNIRYAHGAGRH